MNESKYERVYSMQDKDMEELSEMLDIINNLNGVKGTVKKVKKPPKTIKTITISAIELEKINQNLERAYNVHEENSRKSWIEASRYIAGN